MPVPRGHEGGKGKAAHPISNSGRVTCGQAAMSSAVGARSAAAVATVAYDCKRVILHFDVDAMYAQVEENRDPSLATRPMGTVSYILLITCILMLTYSVGVVP